MSHLPLLLRSPHQLHIPVKTPASSTYDSYFNIIRASIRILLDSSITDELPATYEKLYSACRAVVCEADRGEGLYENLKLSLEQCVGRVSRQLLELSQPGIHWLQPFVEACEWFEGRVVSWGVRRVLVSVIYHLYSISSSPFWFILTKSTL